MFDVQQLGFNIYTMNFNLTTNKLQYLVTHNKV